MLLAEMAELADAQTKDPVTALGREGSSPSFRRVTSQMTGFFVLKNQNAYKL